MILESICGAHTVRLQIRSLKTEILDSESRGTPENEMRFRRTETEKILPFKTAFLRQNMMRKSLQSLFQKNPRVLVAYFSYSGNTKSAAEYISKSLKQKFGDEKVDLVELEMKNPYRGGIYDVSQPDLVGDSSNAGLQFH